MPKDKISFKSDAYILRPFGPADELWKLCSQAQMRDVRQ